MRPRLLIAIAVASLVTGVAASQSTLAPRIPRRVLFAPPTGVELIADVEIRALLERLPDYLYTTVSESQPVVRVVTEEEARSRVEVVVDADALIVRLATGSDGPAQRSLFRPFSSQELLAFVDETSAWLAGNLGLVEPLILLTQSEQAISRQQVVEEVEFADQVATPWELTLWASGVLRLLEFSDEGVPPTVELFPVIFDTTWYFQRFLGLTASLWYQQTGYLYFGEDASSVPADTYSWFILPGVGIAYRTLDVLAANIGATLYLGPVVVTNNDSVTIGDDSSSGFVPFLDPGQTKTVLYTTLQLQGGISYNLSPKWSVRTRFSLNIYPPMLIGVDSWRWYPNSGNSAFFSYFAIGATYRL